jgi:hypothetical protein
LEKPATATPLTEDALARQIVSAYLVHFGHPPDRETAELLLALVDIENAHGNAIIQHNWGNISCFASDAVDYWRPPWFDLDKVNALPDGPNKTHLLAVHQQMVDHKAPSAFRALPDHDAGARVFLSNVKPSMYAAASTGDPMAFANAYWSSGYCPDQACKDSGPTFRSLQTAIRAKGYFSELEPSDAAAVPAKKKLSAREAETLLPHLPQPPSVSPSFGRLFAGRNADMKRELVVFAASCELEDFELLVEQKDAAGIDGAIRSFWADVLKQAPEAPHPKEWCGAFALWCIHQAGLGLELRWMFGPPHYGFLYNLPITHAPQPGDVAYLDKPYQHHAIVIEVEGETVHTIDGNQGAESPIKAHSLPLSHWTAFYSIEPLLAEAVA